MCVEKIRVVGGRAWSCWDPAEPATDTSEALTLGHALTTSEVVKATAAPQHLTYFTLQTTTKFFLASSGDMPG